MKGERQGAQVTLRKILSRYQEKKIHHKSDQILEQGPGEVMEPSSLESITGQGPQLLALLELL